MNLLESTIALAIAASTTYATVDYVQIMSDEIQTAHAGYLEIQKENIKKARSLNFDKPEFNDLNESSENEYLD